MIKKYVSGLLMCLVAVLFWGGMFPVMGPALEIMDPFYFTLFRYGSVGIIFSILLLVIEGKNSFRVEGNYFKIWLFGTSAFAGFSFLVFLGQKMAGSSGVLIASVMMAVQPLLGVLVNWVYKKKKPKISSLFCMIIAAVGVFMVVTKGDISALFQNKNSSEALFLILMGALCWVIYTTGGGDFPEWSILRYTTLTTVYGVCSVIVILMVTTAMGFLKIPKVSAIIEVSGPLVYMIVFAGVIAVFCWNYGNRIVGAINGILFMNLVPITSFLISIINGYKVTSYEFIGVSVTILALILNNLLVRRANNH